ncbi:MAG TPA: PadR family transcriptional regulator [Bryobacteraceae bacterium]
MIPGEFEQVVLLAVLRLGENAYGVTIRSEIAERTGRQIAPGALYTTLDRLEDKGCLASRMGDPTPERGGRAKRYYVVTAAGLKSVTEAQRAFRNLLEGLSILGACHV